MNRYIAKDYKENFEMNKDDYDYILENSPTDVDSDNCMEYFDRVFKNKWSYDIIREGAISIDGVKYISITAKLYTPINSTTGIADVKLEAVSDRRLAINLALKDAAVRILSVFTTIKRQESSKPISNLETLEKEIKEEDNARREESADNTIRPDQIEALNKIKVDYKLDDDEKFNSYISLWGEEFNYSVNTKSGLASSGAKKIDEFLSWFQGFIDETQEIRNKVNSPI